MGGLSGSGIIRSILSPGMGYEEEYFKRSEEEMLLYILDHPTPAVMNLSEEDKHVLREGGSIAMPFSDHLKIGTPSGKFCIVNEELEVPVPCYLPSYGDSEETSAGAGSLRLVAAPSVYTLNSEFRDRSDLIKPRGEQKLMIHSRDAKKRRIKNGDRIIAYNARSRVFFRAVVTDLIAPGNVVCEGIYRRDQCQEGRAFNALTSERLSDMGEGTTMNDNRVEIRKC